MKKIGIIVDGQGDKAAIDSRYLNQFRVIKTDGPRGHCTPIDKIVSKSRKQISILESFNCRKIIIICDFECRTTNYNDFVESIKKEFEDTKFSVPVSVVIPNQMIENWYLADIETLSQKKNAFKDKLKQKNYEGKHGKSELKKLLKKNIKYNEVKHGKEYFPLIKESIAITNSTSFKSFTDEIK